MVLRTPSRAHQDILPDHKTAPWQRRTMLRSAENSETDPVCVAVQVSAMGAEAAEPIYIRDRRGESGIQPGSEQTVPTASQTDVTGRE